jgi:glycosyltransferase involved in cell wall biosynthesis
MSPRPVLVISNHGEIVGGGELSLLGLLAHLDRTRWAPVVAVPSEGAVAERVRALGLPVRVIPLPTLRRPGLSALGAVRALRRLIRDAGAVLVHANGSRAMLYGGLAGRLAGRPVVWHVRIAEREPVLDAILLALASAVIVNSQAVGRRFPRARAGLVRCIHNGVDLGRFGPRPPSPALRAALEIPEGVPVVASVGRFVPWKGYRVLLEAARLAGAALPDIHWLLVGDGEERPELEAQARALGIGPRVRFTGWREDVPDLLALCDLFALPSFGEHFGRVLVEAMAMGKAIVATEAGGVPEVVPDGACGLLVPAGDPRAMADAVLTLLPDPARRERLGQAGRRRAEIHFDIVRHAETVGAVYAALTAGGRGGA